MALLLQGLCRGEYGLVCAGSSSNLANPLTKGPRGIRPTMSVKLPLLRALETNITRLDTCSAARTNLVVVFMSTITVVGLVSE
jgi:hypothetical protein